MASLVVSYPQSEGASFDAAYYRDTHIPLVERSTTIAAAGCAPSAGQRISAPVSPKFTNIQPSIYRTT